MLDHERFVIAGRHFQRGQIGFCPNIAERDTYIAQKAAPFRSPHGARQRNSAIQQHEIASPFRSLSRIRDRFS